MANLTPILAEEINNNYNFLLNSLDLKKAKYAINKLAKIHEIAYQLSTSGIIEATFSDYMNNHPGCFNDITLPCAQGQANLNYSTFTSIISSEIHDPSNKLDTGIISALSKVVENIDLKSVLIEICMNQTLGIAEEQCYCTLGFFEYANSLLS